MLGFAPIAASPLGAPSANETFSISAQNGVYALSLQGAGKLITDIYPSGAFLLNGRAVGLNIGNIITAENATYTLSGSTADIETRSNDANILLDRNYGLVAASESFTGTLHDATLMKGFGIIAESNAFALSGQDLILQIAVSISADSGSFVLTGQDAFRKIGEVFGQLFRIAGAATKTAFGLVPTGNTGGTNVSPFKVMPIKPELDRILKKARSYEN